MVPIRITQLVGIVQYTKTEV